MSESRSEDSERVMDTGLCIAAATEEERHLAQQARNEFDNGQYDTCLSTLQKLGAKRGQDLKVSHNKAVTEYYKSGFTRTDDFKATLSNITSKV